MAGLLLNQVILRECTNDGKLASGAQLYFTESGNDIAKTVYSDLECTIPRTNPVICDASGWAGAIYGKGLYRIRVCDWAGAQIVPPVDGIGSNAGEDSSSSVGYTFVGTYADIRALSGNVTVAYCTGRTVAGDGGEGLFELVPGSTETDDDGVILTNTSGSMVWRRITDGFLNPRWYGVVYNALVTQNPQMIVALRSSARHNIPLRLMGKIYLTSNLSIPTGASICGIGSFVSGNTANVTFEAGSKLISDSINIFGQNITAQINSSASTEIKFTYFSDVSDDDILSKFLASPVSSDQMLVIDRTINIASQDISTDHPITFINNSSIICTGIISGTMTISMPNLILPESPYQIFNLDRTQVANYAFNFGDNYLQPDWFGVQTTDWWFEVKMAALSGKLEIPQGKIYPVLTSMGTFSSLSIHGKGTLNLYIPLNVTGELNIEYTTIQNNYSGVGITRKIASEYSNNKLYLDRTINSVKAGDVFKIFSGSSILATITASADSDGTYIPLSVSSIKFTFSFNAGVYANETKILDLSNNTQGWTPPINAGDVFSLCTNGNYLYNAPALESNSQGLLHYDITIDPTDTSPTRLLMAWYSYTPKLTGYSIKLYSTSNTPDWGSAGLLSGHSASIDSHINATASTAMGFNLYDLSEKRIYSDPFLYRPCLPQILSADYLSTDPAGYIVAGKAYNVLVSGTDFSVDCSNMSTAVPARTDSLILTPLSRSVAMIDLKLRWDRTTYGSTGVPSTADPTWTCGINLHPISDLMKYWINDHVVMIGYSLKAVSAVQDDAIPATHWPVHIPQGLSAAIGNDYANFGLLGARWTGTPRGLVQSAYGPHAATPAAASSNMGWNDIFGDVGFGSQNNVVCVIEFSAMLLKSP